MRIKDALILSIALTALAAVVSAWAAAVLPDAPVVVHWGVDGRPNGWWPKSTALLFGPAMMAAMTALFAVMPRLQPQSARLERSPVPYGAAWLLAVGVILLSHLLIVATAAGRQLNVLLIVFAAVGAGQIALGNVLPKVRFNYVLGVRTPWTLADERVWDATHRVLGPCMMLWGVAILVATLLSGGRGASPVAATLGGGIVFVALSLGYSYAVYRRLRG